MKLVSLGALLSISTLALAQEPVVDSDQSHLTPPNPTADSASPPQATPFTPLTPEEKVRRRALRLVEPVTLFSAAFGAGFNQLRNEPEQWGQGAEGYAKRFASAEGYIAAHNTIALGFDLALHLDPRYRRLGEGGFKPRMWNAVRQTFIADKDSGGTMINVSELAGSFGAGFIANTWEPAGHNGVGDGLTRGTIGLAYHTLKNVVREFLPDLMHPGKHASSGKSSD
jgi:hypothetical protein